MQLSNQGLLTLFLFTSAVIGVGYFSVIQDFPELGITGFSVREDAVDTQFPDHSLGFYSVMPHTRTQLDYDFSINENIRASLQEIIGCVQLGGTVQSCMDRQTTQELKWTLNCDRTEESTVFNDFANALRQTLESSDECVETFSVEQTLIEKDVTITFDKNKEQTLKLTSEQNEQEVSGAYFARGIPQSMTFHKHEDGDVQKITLQYLDRKVEITGLWLYLRKYDAKDSSYVELLHRSEKGVVASTEAEDISVSIDTSKTCERQNIPIYQFCVETKRQITTIDKQTGMHATKPLTIKFAAHMPISPPGPVQGLIATDFPKDDDYVVLSWKKPAEEGVTHFNIYTSLTSAGALEQGRGLLQDSPLVGLDTFYTQDQQLLSIPPLFTTCSFDRFTRECTFTDGTNDVVLQDEVLYYEPTQERYVLLHPLNNFEEHSITVTALDKLEREIDNRKEDQLAPIIKAQVIDDMPPDSVRIVEGPSDLYEDEDYYTPGAQSVIFPSFSKPTVNLDGSTPSGEELIWTFATSQLITGDTTLAELAQMDAPLKPAFGVGGQLEVFIHKLELTPGSSHSIVVVSLDPTDDLHPEYKYTINELGATIFKLNIPPNE